MVFDLILAYFNGLDYVYNMPMFRFCIIVISFFAFSLRSFGQTDPLFDQQHIASVKIFVSEDTVAWLYENVTSDRYFRATLVYENESISDTVKNVGFRLRGNTSRYSRKKSFKLSFNTFQTGRRYRGVKKLNLNGQHNDPTMVREKLYYNVWNKLGLPNRRTSFVKVYINSAYYGFYTSLEEMDNDWLSRVYGINIGNLYKCVYPADLTYLGSNQQTYKNLTNGTASGGRVYDLKTNQETDDYSGFVKFVKNINEATGNNAEQKIKEVLNLDLFIKVLALDVATGHWDNYGYNKNNFYLHHNPFTDKFDFISYDTDNTFGVDWVNIDWAQRSVVNWIHPTGPRPLASRVLAAPDFQFRYFKYLDSISRYVLHPFYISSSIDSMQAFVRQAAINDTYRSLDYGYTLQDFDRGFTNTVDAHTPYGIKPFLAQRASNTIRELLIPLQTKEVKDVENKPRVVLKGSTIEIFDLENGGLADLSITDVTGKVIFQQQTKERIVPINHLKQGFYFFRLQTATRLFVGKLQWSATH